jgi:hypothetical protein
MEATYYKSILIKVICWILRTTIYILFKAGLLMLDDWLLWNRIEHRKTTGRLPIQAKIEKINKSLKKI